ncbi:MAG: phosphodiester glycosidase family protein [Rhodothermales bacterium]|nr:phosphodiester glycosidase family protein [Rhodothermales bacterium]
MRQRLLRLVLGLALVLSALPAAAQSALTARFDTVTSRLVGPGMRYTAIRAPEMPWNIWVLEVDLTNPYVTTEAVKSQDRRALANELTSAMAQRKNVPGRRVVGAINAGFFAGGGVVLGVQINNGEVVGPMVEQNSDYSSVAFNRFNRGMIKAIAVTATVTSATAGSRAVNAFNMARSTDQLVVYNRLQGTSTGANAFGTEVIVRPLDPWALNATIRAEVVEKRTGLGNAPIANGNVVLSGHGTAAAYLDGLTVGETVTIAQNTTPSLRELTQVVSGYPVLLNNGVKHTLPNSTHHTARHPRTAMGINRDTTKLWMVVVDGRTSLSAGMTNYEQQDLFLRLGAWNAQGLDGGGSSTMVINGSIANLPSDGPGTERAVGDAFLVYSTAPVGPMRYLSVSPLSARMFLRGTAQMTVTGADEYYGPVAIDQSRLTYEVAPASLGTVSSTGLFTAGTLRGDGVVRVRYDTLVDSVLVTVKGVKTVVQTPEDVVLDTTRTVTFRARTYDDDNLEQTLPAGEVTFRSLDPSVVTVDAATGLARGLKAGQTTIVSTARGVSDSSAVRIEIGTGIREVAPIDTSGAWSVAPQGLDAGSVLSTATDANASNGKVLRFDYVFTESPTNVPVATLWTDVPIYGVPDTVRVHIRSDGGNHRAFLEFEDATGQAFRTSVPRYVNDTAVLAPMPGPFVRSNIPTASIVFPVRFKGVRLELAYVGGRVSGKTYSGSFWLDEVVAHYPATATASELDERPDASMAFVSAAPNPTTGRTRVTFTSDRPQAVRLTVYDLLGRERSVAFEGVAVSGTNTMEADLSMLPVGVYFLRGTGGFAVPMMLRVVR